MGDELSQSEPPSTETIFKGFLKRASKDPEVPKLERKFDLYREKYGTSLGFSYSLSVPKKKRSDSSGSPTEYMSDGSSQSEVLTVETIIAVDKEKNGSTLGFLYSVSVPKKKRSVRKKRSVIIPQVVPKKKRSDSTGSSIEYMSDESSQSEPPRQPVLEVEVEPPMPKRFKAIIGRMSGSDIRFVIEKALTETDLQQQSNRLSLPRKQVKTDSFLTNEEKDILDAKEQNGIGVLLVTPCEKSVRVKLKKWRMSNGFIYAIIGAWVKQVVDDADNRLEVGKMVRLWSFRNRNMLSQHSQLCFVLDCD
ncbi:hypothetical protein Patl1_23096 [Pistacia atlantica]|uniref:Uncharacterized protein n=1 Tax=Pistacia atlantica TaxID=434234 RepID=A0ACC1A077_9ROSI|nr:hypothetical protein Patl1_23096 [Pistacia atlantica]